MPPRVVGQSWARAWLVGADLRLVMLKTTRSPKAASVHFADFGIGTTSLARVVLDIRAAEVFGGPPQRCPVVGA
jgi:hypothetical protein